MRCMLAAMLTMVILIGSSAVRAQEEGGKPDINAAKTAFKAGQEFLKMDRFADAVVEFKKAYEITKDKLVMGQIALAYEKAGDYKNALAAIEVYRAALPESDRVSVDQMIARFKKLIAQGRNKTLVLPTDKSPPTEVADKTPAGEPADKTPPEQQKKKGRFWTWIAAGSAGALALGALVVGLNAQSKYDDMEASCAPSCADSEVDSVRTRATVTDVLWGMAAGAAIAAGVLYFVERPSSERSAPAKEVPEEPEEEEEERFDDLDDEDVQAVSKRLTVVPIVAPGGFGLGATLRY